MKFERQKYDDFFKQRLFDQYFESILEYLSADQSASSPFKDNHDVALAFRRIKKDQGRNDDIRRIFNLFLKLCYPVNAPKSKRDTFVP